ncbi:hypothetical protein [uncultured Nocardioides sp.]|nr:hypothetical protein [uncultured Nocardioides sp.]
MTDENPQPETDDVEGHKRRNLFVADETDDGDDDDVEGHKRRSIRG